MTNKERYKDAIVEVAIQGETFGVSKVTEQIIICGLQRCRECIFYNDQTDKCNDEIARWSNEEYKEKGN